MAPPNSTFGGGSSAGQIDHEGIAMHGFVAPGGVRKTIAALMWADKILSGAWAMPE